MSDDARLPRAVLDTDVIYSRVLHELIGRLAHQERLLTLTWSDELLDEAKRILLERKHADLLLTFDHGYVNESLAEQGIRVLTPDAFLDTTLQENPAAIMGATQSQAEVWGGGRTVDELLDAIQRAGATMFASNARCLINR